MQPIEFVFPTDRPEGPFTIEFSYIPDSLDEVKLYAHQVMDCVRDANVKAEFGLSEKILNSMAHNFEEFLLNLYVSHHARRLLNERVGKSIRRLSDRITNYLSIAEERVDG